ncbi:MAG: ATP-dependent RNA helicase HrpA, partial [Syntrophobacterales bacterium]|nr:ATP-dependent RNA helicase HrpA [Syntrophobacterales bacterium]
MNSPSPPKPPPQLPLLACKDEILKAIADHPVIIICGETGSGKSTQLPQLCLAAGRGEKKKIACTQPRRIAAVTITRRIAEERNEEIGETVGYKIRFEERMSRRSVIKVMTDGVLLAETQRDPLLLQYDTIIVDEAHERSVNIDFILGLLRTILKKRKDLKVIITSATLDTENFSQAFNKAPVIHVSGRLYHVDLLYQPLDTDMEDQGEATYIDAAANAVEYLLLREDQGDILVFLPAEHDIRECLDLLKGRDDGNTLFLPLFSRLAWPDQQKVFLPSPSRKVILATNIAETSLTIPRIRFVVDTGLARILSYNPSTGTTSLPILPVSQSSADQRKGRCGRVQNGLCIRLYSEADYAARPKFNTPEIMRSNLAGIILKMLSLNMGDIHSFPFIDKPSPRAIKSGFNLLWELGAIVKNTARTKTHGPCQLTDKGKWMAMLPIDPRVARMIIEGLREECLREVMIIASALSVQDPRERPAEKEKEADSLHRLLRHPHSDFLTFLHIWRLYETNKALLQSQNKMRKFCKAQFLSYRRIREWVDIYQQINDILQQYPLFRENLRPQEQTTQTTESSQPLTWDPQHPLYAAIHKSILSGYLSHIAQKKEKMIFKATHGKNVFIFPGSALFQKSGDWIVAAEYVETTKLYARTAARINPDWLEKSGAHLCKRTYSDPHWSKSKGEVMAFMQISLFGLIIAAKRPVVYGRIDPALSRQLFIEALVNNDVARPLPFLTHNQQLIKNIKGYEDKMRRTDLLASEEKQYDFYRHRLPPMASMKELQKFLLESGADEMLRMTEKDLLEQEIDGEAMGKNYPDTIQRDGITFSLTYAFEPGAHQDGVTLKVPLNAIKHLPHHGTNIAVPGLQEEVIHHLLKNLPKEYRKQLQPIGEKISPLLREIPAETKNFFHDLQFRIKNLWNVDIPLSAWCPEKLPDHLRIRYEIIDAEGSRISASRDIDAIRNHDFHQQENRAWTEAQEKWEMTNITSLTPDELPERIPLIAG